MRKQEKMKSVDEFLAEVREVIEDHLEEEGLKVHAIDLVKMAVQLFEDFSEKGGGK